MCSVDASGALKSGILCTSCTWLAGCMTKGRGYELITRVMSSFQLVSVPDAARLRDMDIRTRKARPQGSGMGPHTQQHTTNNTQQTTHNKQHTTHNTQHTTNNKQQPTHNKQHTTHNNTTTTHNNTQQQPTTTHNNQQQPTTTRRLSQACPFFLFASLFHGPQRAAQFRSCTAAEAATTALVVATRAAVDRWGPGHVVTPLRPTGTEEGPGRGVGERDELQGQHEQQSIARVLATLTQHSPQRQNTGRRYELNHTAKL